MGGRGGGAHRLLLCGGLEPALKAKQPGQLLSCNQQPRVKKEADFNPSWGSSFVNRATAGQNASPFFSTVATTMMIKTEITKTKNTSICQLTNE